jgi:hypothetical protein
VPAFSAAAILSKLVGEPAVPGCVVAGVAPPGEGPGEACWQANDRRSENERTAASHDPRIPEWSHRASQPSPKSSLPYGGTDQNSAFATPEMVDAV